MVLKYVFIRRVMIVPSMSVLCFNAIIVVTYVTWSRNDEQDKRQHMDLFATLSGESDIMMTYPQLFHLCGARLDYSQ